MAERHVTDVSALEEPADTGSKPRRGSGRALFFGEIVKAASVLPSGRFHVTPLCCRRRPNRQRCKGRIEISRHHPSDAIEWRCNLCADAGKLTNWRDTRWDLGAELEHGNVVSLFAPRLDETPRAGAIERVYLLGAELLGGPLAFEGPVVRRLKISGNKSLHDLHHLICDSHGWPCDDAYEFMFGAPYEIDAQRYTGVGSEHELCDPVWETQTMALDDLGLETGQSFGYLLDFDAEWVHRITVLDSDSGRSCASITRRIGRSPAREHRHHSLSTDDDEVAGFPLSALYGPYRATEAPLADTWLSMEELERLVLILEAHDARRPKEGGLAHALIHELAETAIAQGRIALKTKSASRRHAEIHRIGRRLLSELIGEK